MTTPKIDQSITSVRFVHPLIIGGTIRDEALLAAHGWSFEISGGSLLIRHETHLRGKVCEVPRSVCLVERSEG